jgi:hypothetical protein
MARYIYHSGKTSHLWCHICGTQREDFVDIYYPEDAFINPHKIVSTDIIKHILICSYCVQSMHTCINEKRTDG